MEIAKFTIDDLKRLRLKAYGSQKATYQDVLNYREAKKQYLGCLKRQRKQDKREMASRKQKIRRHIKGYDYPIRDASYLCTYALNTRVVLEIAITRDGDFKEWICCYELN